MDAMILVKAIVFGMILVGVGGFIIWKFSKETIDKDLNRLNKETETVRAKQTELNEKIKQASEELTKRQSEADALTIKMREEAENKAKEEREKIMAKARQEGEEIIVKANRTKDEIRRLVIKDADMRIIDFAGTMLAEILSPKGKAALDECLISEFIDNLNKVDMEMIGEEITIAEVTTSSALTESLRNRLSEVLQQKLGRTIQVKATVDTTLVSGIILKFGSLSLDGSLMNMIRENSTVIKEKLEKGLIESKSLPAAESKPAASPGAKPA